MILLFENYSLTWRIKNLYNLVLLHFIDVCEMGLFLICCEYLFLLLDYNSLGFPGGSDGKESACNVVWSLDQENPLEKRMATHSSILTWKIPQTQTIIYGVAKSWTRLSDWMFVCIFMPETSIEEVLFFLISAFASKSSKIFS